MLSLALTLALATPSTEAGPLLATVPKNSFVVVQTAPWQTIRQRSDDSAWSRFFADESWSSIMGLMDLGSTLDEAMADSEFPDPREVFAELEGRMAFFLCPDPEGGTVAGGLLVESAGSDDPFRSHFRRFADVAASDSNEHTETHAGVELRVLTRSEFSADEPNAFVFFETDARIGIGAAETEASALALARDLVERVTGESDELGFDQNPAYSVRSVEPAFQVTIDLMRLQHELDADWRRNESARDTAMLEALGFADMRWVRMYADIGEGERLAAGVEVHVPSGSLMGALASRFGRLDGSMAEGMPADSIGIGMGQFDFYGAYKDVLKFVETTDPDAYRELRNGLMQGSMMLGGDIERDVLAQFDGRFSSFTMRVPQQEAMAAMAPFMDVATPSNTLMQGGAFFIGLKDSRRVQEFVSRLTEMAEGGMGAQMPLSIDNREVGGNTVTKLSVEGMFELSWAFTDDGLVMSQYPSAMTAALQDGRTSSAADNPAFAGTLAGLSGASAANLMDTAASVEAILTSCHMMKDMVMSFGMGSEVPTFDLPAPEVAQQYFDGTLAFFVRRNGEELGLHFRAH